MSITERFLSFISSSEKGTDKESPDEVCTVCGNYRQVQLGEGSKDKQADIRNHWEDYMLIQIW